MYSKRKVSKAGEIIANKSSSEEKVQDALHVVSSWRAYHEEPLRKMRAIVENVAAGIPGAITAGRLKRTPAIVEKLQRSSSCNLRTLDDIAGCRIVVPTYENVMDVCKLLSNHETFIKPKDYLNEPKENGYRSIHLIHRCASSCPQYDYLRVEVQVRTLMQHAWATAVESYDVISSSGLKCGDGKPEEFQYFALVSSLIAISENAPLPPNIRLSQTSIIEKLNELENKLHIYPKLNAYLNSVITINENEFFNDCTGFLIEFDNTTQTNLIRGYADDEWDIANQDYLSLEEEMQDSGFALLVNASSLNELKDIYPNYFANISTFLDWMGEYLALEK